jgi:hypothetical protein
VSISVKIGNAPRTRNDLVKKAEIVNGKRAGASAEMAERMKALERENREPRTENREPRTAAGERDPSQGVSVLCDGGIRPPVEVTV